MATQLEEGYSRKKHLQQELSELEMPWVMLLAFSGISKRGTHSLQNEVWDCLCGVP